VKSGEVPTVAPLQFPHKNGDGSTCSTLLTGNINSTAVGKKLHSYECDNCKGERDGNVYHCETCDYEVCLQCASKHRGEQFGATPSSTASK
jgi:hypothetical protein